MNQQLQNAFLKIKRNNSHLTQENKKVARFAVSGDGIGMLESLSVTLS